MFYINKLQFKTAAANKVVTPAVPESGVERFTDDTEDGSAWDHVTAVGTLSSDPGAMADLTFDTVGGSKRLRHYQTGASGTDRSFYLTFSSALTSDFAGKSFEYVVRYDDASNFFSMYLRGQSMPGGDTCFMAVTLNLSGDGLIKAYDSAVSNWVTTGKGCAVNTDYKIKIYIVDTTHYKIYVDDVECTNGGNYWHLQNAMNNVWGFTSYEWVSGKQYWLDDLKPSWTYVAEVPESSTVYPVHLEIDDICADGNVNVQESNAGVFHVGTQIHAHLCPTENNGSDYKVDANFVVREVKWTKDECAEVKLGFAEHEFASSQEMQTSNHLRQRHESTS